MRLTLGASPGALTRCERPDCRPDAGASSGSTSRGPARARPYPTALDRELEKQLLSNVGKAPRVDPAREIVDTLAEQTFNAFKESLAAVQLGHEVDVDASSRMQRASMARMMSDHVVQDSPSKPGSVKLLGAEDSGSLTSRQKAGSEPAGGHGLEGSRAGGDLPEANTIFNSDKMQQILRRTLGRSPGMLNLNDQALRKAVSLRADVPESAESMRKYLEEAVREDVAESTSSDRRRPSSTRSKGASSSSDSQTTRRRRSAIVAPNFDHRTFVQDLAGNSAGLNSESTQASEAMTAAAVAAAAAAAAEESETAARLAQEAEMVERMARAAEGQEDDTAVLPFDTVDTSSDAVDYDQTGEDIQDTQDNASLQDSASAAPNIPNNITSYPYLKLGLDRRMYFPVLRTHLDELHTASTAILAWRGRYAAQNRPLIWLHVHKEAGTFVCLAAVVNGEKVIAPSRNCNWKVYDVMWSGHCNATECDGESHKGIGARDFRPPTCQQRSHYFEKWNFTFGAIERELHREDICPQFRYGTALRRPLLALESTVFFETKNLFNTAIKYGVEVPSGRRRFELDWFKAFLKAVFDDPNPAPAYGLPAWKYLDNFKIRVVLGDDAFNEGPGQIGPTHLQLAIDRLSKFNYVKLLDTTDEWWDGTSVQLGWKRPVSAKQNFHQRESLFDDETTNYLMSLNQYDQQLYEYFLEKQGKSVPAEPVQMHAATV